MNLKLCDVTQYGSLKELYDEHAYSEQNNEISYLKSNLGFIVGCLKEAEDFGRIEQTKLLPSFRKIKKMSEEELNEELHKIGVSYFYPRFKDE